LPPSHKNGKHLTELLQMYSVYSLQAME